ncbi:MAG: YciI family protein [Candidatus Obscuribacterales bacterium]|nr:YciI family protein [Candidatus Obscuribacterales bacterium]
MKYMLLIYGKEQDITETEHAQCREDSAQLCHELQKQGKFIAASPLHSVTTATSLRIRNGKRIITDGPFAETTEQLGGYYIIDVNDLDEALSVASRLPPVTKGTVEIRPIFEMDNLPASNKLISQGEKR